MGWIRAEEAAKRLGVRRRTLYTYVSRGWIRVAGGPDGRSRLYLSDDIDRLRARSEAHKGHSARAAGAVRWGEPVVDSAITLIDPDGPNYRGIPALTLAEQGLRFEQVAELLWTATLPDQATWSLPAPSASGEGSALRRMQVLLATSGPASLEDLDAARALVGALAGTIGGDGASVAERCAPGVDAQALALVDQALVLVADHELNASTFAARVAASTGAGLQACVLAALATFTGPRHGGASDALEQVLAQISGPADASEVWVAARDTGALPGLGHPLHPDGDPRAQAILDVVEHDGAVQASLVAVRELGLPPPNVDFGLVALRRALAARHPGRFLPGWAAGLFAVGRSAGWIAHAREQQAQGFLIRPRARYTGP